MPHGFDRRALLRGGCALLAVAGCQPKEADSATTSDSNADDTGTTPALEYPCGQTVEAGGPGWTELPLANYPDLADVGGWYGVTVGGQSIVVAQVETGCYSAIVRACTHEGAAINYRPERKQYVCPSHGAIYAPNGDIVSGPQPAGLPVFPCGRAGDSVWVQHG